MSALPVPSSSWIVLDGIVWPADVLPVARPAVGRVTEARAKIREAIAKKAGR